MPKAKFDSIYHDLKQRIEAGEYAFQSQLPSENQLTQTYECSRNTIRRALSGLAAIGYVQAMQGRGVRVIYQPVLQNEFTIGGIESFKESADRNQMKASTIVICFEEVTADKVLAQKTGFPEGTLLYHIRRIRCLDGKALILDINYFRRDLVPGLTKAIATDSIYEYIENTLGMTITTSRRRMTVERATREDEVFLALGDYNCLAVISGQTYNADGMQFEYTQSRHQPDYFCFKDTANRKKHI